MSEYTETDADTWVFEVDGFHLDAPQQAKSMIADEHDISYRMLRAKVFEDQFTKYVVVLNTKS